MEEEIPSAGPPDERDAAPRSSLLQAWKGPFDQAPENLSPSDTAWWLEMRAGAMDDRSGPQKIAAWDAAEEAWRRVGYLPAVIRVRSYSGLSLFQQGQREAGIARIEAAIALADTQTDHVHHALRASLVGVYGLPAERSLLYQRATHRHAERRIPDSFALCLIKHNLALTTPDLDEKLALYEQIFAIMARRGFRNAVLGTGYLTAAAALYDVGRYPESVAWYRRAIVYFEREDPPFWRVQAWERLGQSAAQYDGPLARDAYQAALPLWERYAASSGRSAEEIDNARVARWVCTNNLADVEFRMGNYQAAREAAWDSYDFAQNHFPHSPATRDSLLNLASIYQGGMCQVF